MQTVIIREGKSRDRQSFEQLLRAVCKEFRWDFDEDFTPLDVDPTSYRMLGGKLFVAIHNLRVVGCIAFRQRKGIAMLLRFYVHPEFRHKGIGTRLLVTLVKELNGRSISTIFFGTEKENLRYVLPATEILGFHRVDQPPVDFPGEECSIYFACELHRSVRKVA